VTNASTNLTSQEGAPLQKVLVVEAEVLIRLVLADYLRECGYRVFEAAHAEEAVEVLKSPDVSVDVVFSDVQMPGGMDGFSLARWVRTNKPGIHVILTSSVERSADIAATLCEAGPLLGKPYHPKDVVSRIRNLMTKASRG
jgi:DNA-binding response OmpR family regulator